MPVNKLQVLSLIAVIWTILVVTFGAYVRLSDAGLGCPDWPGCYGNLTVPKGDHQIAKANQRFPERKLEVAKAWKEMIHRYLAGVLGILVSLILFLSWRQRSVSPNQFWFAIGLFLLVVYQAILGMLTVTEKLNPAIVTAHLLTGFLTLSLLAWFYFRLKLANHAGSNSTGFIKAFSVFTLIVVLLQIFLGGWTGANYAAIVCYDFPTCYNGQWLPKHDVAEAFVLWRGTGVDYEGGVLSEGARIVIHMTHRLGAIIAAVSCLMLAFFLISRQQAKFFKVAGMVILVLLVLQISLGISIVYMSRPLYLAVAHNGTAALLFATLLIVMLQLRKKQ